MPGDENLVLSLLSSLVILAVVLVLAYLATRYLAVRMTSVRPRGSACHFTVVEQLALGKEAKLLLVQLHECYLLLGITQGSITCLKEFSPGEIEQWTQSADAQAPAQQESFLKRLQDMLEQKRP